MEPFQKTPLDDERIYIMPNENIPAKPLKYFVLLFFFFYCVAGFIVGFASRGNEREFLPVYPWFLFTKVPNSISMYAVLIHELNGERLDPPQLLWKNGGVMTNVPAVKAREVIKRIGIYMTNNQKKGDALALRVLFEKNLLPPNTRYEIIAYQYDPLRRWTTGQFNVKSMGIFNSTSDK